MGFFSMAMACQAAPDPVIMTIAGENIYKSEFEYIYNKNNSVSSSDKKSIREYVDLFINYKLKVAEAKSLGLQAQASYQSEFEKYEKQLVAPYVRDEEAEKELLEEALERRKKSILASHILVPIENYSDTASAWLKINDVYSQLKEGADFATLASKYSSCPSKENGGSLGYVNVFDMVYPFETQMYATPIGSFSKPFRTDFGYHIVKTFAEKECFKDYRFSHILLAGPDNQSKADSIMSLLRKGESFEKLAREHSADNMSSVKGGDLGFLSQGNFPAQIDAKIRGMSKVGDVALCGTAFGVHILKLTDVVPYTDKEDCSDDFKRKLNSSGREKALGESYFEKLKLKYGFESYDNALDLFEKVLNTNDHQERADYYHHMDEPLYMLMGNVYSQEDFFSFFKDALSDYEYKIRYGKIDLNNLKKGQVAKSDFVRYTFSSFVNNKLLDLEKKNIREENPEYRNLLREYSDGLLLFEISNEFVWNKAASDTVGLKEYYQEHKDKYKWDVPRFRGIVVYSSTEEIYKKIEDFINSNTIDRTVQMIEGEYGLSKKGPVRLEKGLYARGVKDAVDDKVFHIIKYSDSSYPYVSVKGKVEEQPVVYQDVKGPVTADYQNYLEEQWIKELRSKYNFKVYEDVLKTVKK